MSGSGRVTPARRAAYEVVRRTFEHDAWTHRAFPAAAERHGLSGRARAQAQALAFGAVARRGTTDHVITTLGSRGPAKLDAPVLAALRLGLYEVLFTRAADHASVGEAVELAKGGMGRGGGRRASGAAGLVNALLRRATRERDEILGALDDATPAEAAVAHSVPEWIAELWWDELGADEARALLRSINEPVETAMRANTLSGDPGGLREELREAGEPIAPPGDDGLLDPPESLVWEGPLGEAALAVLAAGRMFAQSRGAQAVVGLLDPRPGERVLDLCAGPGVKTVALAARVGPDGEVVAVERDPARAAQVRELAERAGADNVRVEIADLAFEGGDGLSALRERGYDRVLVDPPCSDLGTLASRPDVRWRKEPDSIERLAPIQSRILANALGSLASGGALVYSTCTISSRENEDVVVAAINADPSLIVTRTHTSRPDRDGTDGFWAARIERSG